MSLTSILQNHLGLLYSQQVFTLGFSALGFVLIWFFSQPHLIAVIPSNSPFFCHLEFDKLGLLYACFIAVAPFPQDRAFLEERVFSPA